MQDVPPSLANDRFEPGPQPRSSTGQAAFAGSPCRARTARSPAAMVTPLPKRASWLLRPLRHQDNANSSLADVGGKLVRPAMSLRRFRRKRTSSRHPFGRELPPRARNLAAAPDGIAHRRSMEEGPVCSSHKSASRCVAASRSPPLDTGPAGSAGFSSSHALAPSRIKVPPASPAFIDRTTPDVRPTLWHDLDPAYGRSISCGPSHSRPPAWLTASAFGEESPCSLQGPSLRLACRPMGGSGPPETLAVSFFPRRLWRLPRAASLQKS